MILLTEHARQILHHSLSPRKRHLAIVRRFQGVVSVAPHPHRRPLVTTQIRHQIVQNRTGSRAQGNATSIKQNIAGQSYHQPIPAKHRIIRILRGRIQGFRVQSRAAADRR